MKSPIVICRLLLQYVFIASLAFSAKLYAQTDAEPETDVTSEAAANTAPDSEEGDDTISVLPLEDLRVFTKAYDHIRNAYIDKIDDRTLLEYAIRGMLEQLDPHSAFLDASSFDDLQVHTTGEFGGLGIEVGMENGFVKVISPIDDTPAAKAGVEAGDLIIKLDNVSVKGLSLDEAVEKMRGETGTDIVLTIVREGEDKPFDLTLTRDIIKVRSVRSEIIEDNYGYLRIAQFQLGTASDLEAAYKKMLEKNKNLHGLVLDLRNNPGGVLTASVDVADMFLDGGMVVYTEGRLSESNNEYKATPGDHTHGTPLVVLINGGSASASEIVAGALQDHRRALILGTRSFGKGSVQTVIPITDDRAIKLTTALYYTPNGRSIQAQGIVPDINVERVRVTAVRPHTSIKEADLSRHLKNTKGGEEVSAQDDKAETELYNRDSQLYEALNILKSLYLFQQKPDSAAKEEQTADVTQG